MIVIDYERGVVFGSCRAGDIKKYGLIKASTK